MVRIALFGLVVSLAACSNRTEEGKAAAAATAPPATAPAAALPVGTPAATPSGIDAAAAKQLIAAGAAVIDVRTPEEFSGGRLERATNIPVQDLATRLAEVDGMVAGDKSKPVVLYCRSGKRAAAAKQQLEAAGYTRVVNGGGLTDVQ